MGTAYDRIAGQSVERLAALSDGVFAVAMTLLVLDLRAPAREAIHSEHELWHALVALAPRLLIYMMSFLTLGIFWIGQQTQLNHLTRSHRSLSWIHIAFLRGFDHAFFNRAARGIHRVSHCAARLLAEHWASRHDAVLQLDVRN